MLEVRLLGAFAIQCDGKSVTLSSRASQSLFSYLILAAGTLHRREKLAGMLWPDEPEEKARAYLRNELWRIRKAFTTISHADYLIADDISISFNSSAEYWLDVTALENVGEIASIQELMDALSAYQGELLPGFYEDWIVFEREHLQAVYEQKMMQLLELLQREKRWNEILEWVDRWISLGQAPEAAYRALMVAYDALGDRAKVASTYERCVQALRALGVEPSEQTRTLAFTQASKLNIPIPLSSFIGREKELKEVTNMLSKSRLVTLTGSGGVGKTRLAIQDVADVLELFPDGVWFLDLATLSNPTLVPNTLAGLLGLRESGELSVNDLLINYLRSRTALIIFDNCEHLIEACAQLINSLLTSCEHLSILATSREVLRLPGEAPYRVPSLEIPQSDIDFTIDELMNIESVKLFAERAVIVSPSFTINSLNAYAVARICQKLDGIPLGIELAAARVQMLSVEQIARYLDDCFRLLTRGHRIVLPRHQTMRAVIDWSYNLLPNEERTLLQHLSVFVGGWTLDASESVCENVNMLDLLTSLVDKSLVDVDREHIDEPRYYLLETICQYAREKLAETSEEEQIRGRHLDYFLKLANTAEPELYGAGQIEWARKLEDDHENLRAALEWSLHAENTKGQQLAGALWRSWYLNGYLSEGYEWLEKMLKASVGDETLIRAKLLSAQGTLAHTLGYSELAKKLSRDSIALFRKLGDEFGTALPLNTLGWISHLRSDYDLNIQSATESLNISKAAGDQWGVSQALMTLGYNASLHGHFEQAQKFYEESLSICKEIGDQEGIAFTLYGMAGLPVPQENTALALELYEEALYFAKAGKTKPIAAQILTEMGQAASYSGDYRRGSQLLEEALEIHQKMGDRWGVARAVRYLAWTVRLQGDYPKARSRYLECLQLSQQLQDKDSVTATLRHVSNLMFVQGSPEKFVCLLSVAEKVDPEGQRVLLPSFSIENQKFNENAHAILGEEAYAAAWNVGQQMSLEEAIEYALKELQLL